MERNSSAIMGIVIALVVVVGGIWYFASRDNDDKKTTTTSQTTKTNDSTSNSKQTIVDVAAGNPDFSTLVDLVKSAGLVETLSGEGPFTVFAPTNEAFAKVPADTLASLKADPAKLKDVLTYHVVSGKVGSKDVVGLTSAKTVEGKDIAISVMDGKVILNGNSTVVKTDVEASNGVIHVIDTVLLPPSN